MFTEAVRRAQGVVDLRAIAGFIAWRLAARPADRFRLSPRKGRIASGSDADIVLFDPRREWTLEASAVQTRSGLTPYTDRSFTGAVVRTLVRGTTVFVDGEFPARAGHGRFVAAEHAA